MFKESCLLLDGILFLLNERNIEYYPYLKYWVYDNIYMNLLTLENMKGSVIIRYEKDIETID
jgi:hypothetical protein